MSPETCERLLVLAIRAVEIEEEALAGVRDHAGAHCPAPTATTGTGSYPYLEYPVRRIDRSGPDDRQRPAPERTSFSARQIFGSLPTRRGRNYGFFRRPATVLTCV